MLKRGGGKERAALDQVWDYRVLLTRARQGMVIFVPPGSSRDPRRKTVFYDSNFNYLTDLGIAVIK
jgi:hypothetical protein